MTPTTARLVGPEKSLAAIDSVTTVPMEITSVSGGFTRNVPIDTMPLGIVRLSPKQVTVTGEMGTIAERSFAGIPSRRAPARSRASSSRRHAYRSPSADLKERVQALTRDSLRVVATSPARSRRGAHHRDRARGINGPRHSRFRHAAAAGDSHASWLTSSSASRRRATRRRPRSGER